MYGVVRIISKRQYAAVCGEKLANQIGHRQAIAADRGLNIDYTFKPRTEGPSERIGLRVTETMRGFFSVGDTADLSVLPPRDRQVKAVNIETTLTIATDDLSRMLSDEAHEAAVIGTVSCSELADGAMTITNGQFNLLAKKSADSRVRLGRVLI